MGTETKGRTGGSVGAVRTADGIDHGNYETVYCLEALVEKYEDGYINCPILYCGGKCDECYQTLMEREEKENA